MSDKKDVLIKILEINEISFNYKPFPIPVEDIEFGKNLIYGLGINLNFDFENEILKLKLLLNYTINEINDSVLKLESEIVFHIKNLNKAIVPNEKDNKVNINDDLFSTLLGVIIGSTRGILSTKTRGTAFSAFPLPIINVKDVLKQIKVNNK